MLVLSTRMEVDPIVWHIEAVVSMGMERGAYLVASHLQKNARLFLEEGIKRTAALRKHTRKSTGRLSKAILKKNGNTGLKSYARWDVVVDTKRAPYAMWVELGRSAPKQMLPYANNDSRDYSKSTFEGHKYLLQSISHMSKVASVIVAGSIIAALHNPANYANIGQTLEV